MTHCTRKACGAELRHGKGKPVIIGSLLHHVCPDCYRELYNFMNANNLGQTIKERKEKASRYAEERFMSMGFPQRLALPGVTA